MYIFIIILNIILIKNYISKPKYINNNYNSNNTYYLIFQIENNIEKIWGKNEIIFIKKNNLLKYIDNNKTRIYIDFQLKKIIIESIINDNYKNNFKNIIIDLLISDNIHKYYNNNYIFKKSGKSFLYGKIIDNLGYPILSKKDAINYANYIINNNINFRNSSNNKLIIYTKIDILNNNNYNYNNYMNIILKYSKIYNIDKCLILSIMNIESNFNPYAISNYGAIGLMQIVKNKSGLDVFKNQGKIGIPSEKYLFNPENNINIGTAYLSILQKKYLNKIKNYKSLRYLTISSYNCGINNLLKMFSLNNEKAINILNNMDPDLIYYYIYNNHNLEETRNYLIKVNNLYKYYKNKLYDNK